MKLTFEEQKVMGSLVDAWNEFRKLPTQHPSEIDEFCEGIHRCQNLLAMRVARRADPENFKTYNI